MNQQYIIKNIIHSYYNKLFLIADVHLGVRNNSLEWLNNIENYFKNFLIPTIKSNIDYNTDAPCLIILGDVFDNRQTMDIQIMNIALDLFEELSKIIPILILSGNHDIYKKINNDVNSLRILKSINNISVIEKPSILHLEHDLLKNPVNIGIIPWLGYHEIESSYLSNNELDYALMHTDIRGLSFDNGRTIYAGVDTKQFKGKKIFSGHIHKRQESNNIIYVGSPYQLRRSDIGNSKGIYEINLIDDTIKFYENTYSPKFLKIKIEDILELTIDKVEEIFQNNYTDIIIPIKYINRFNVAKLLDSIQNCKYKKIELIVDKSEQIITDDSSIVSIKDSSIETYLSKEINKLDLPENNKKILNQLSEYYIKQAKTEFNKID